jgi:uncharacterized protein YqeY
MMMGLKKRLQDDLKQALRDREEIRKTTLRLALAAIKNAEIAQGKELDDEGLIAVLSQQAKQRRESIDQFRKGNRDDLVAQEESELQILLEYLPPQLSEDEISTRAREVIVEMGANSPAQMGEVMRVLMPQLRGKADGRVVSTIVKQILSEMG